MSSINVITIVGRLGRDPEVRQTKAGKAVCDISIATDDGWGENKQTNWHTVTLWDKTAEVCGQYCKKGDRVGVVGRLTYDTYEKDGVKHTRAKIVSQSFQMLSDKKEGGTKTAGLPDNPEYKKDGAGADESLPF